MKIHTSDFKNEIRSFGRELDNIITYEFDGETIKLGNEQLNSISPHYEGTILKSVMRQLDIESTIDIPLETIINYTFGIKIDKYYETEDETYQDNVDYYKLQEGEYVLVVKGTDYQIGDTITGTVYIYINYEYINFGNYIVYKSEKQEDTNSWKITCYDKMLNTMVNYENLNIEYPITIRSYIDTLCQHLGLTFKDRNNVFANYDKEIPNELFLDTEGNNLGYTFRDVLDQLAEATASTICINEDNDQLEIRYINNNYGEQIEYEILGLTTQNGTPTPNNPVKIKNKTQAIVENIDDNDYVINIGNIELCKIGEYQDYIYKNNDKWYLHKEIDKVVFDGTESGWARYVIGSNIVQYYIVEPSLHNAYKPMAISNYFRQGIINNRGIGYENSVYTYTNGIAFNPTNIDTINDWCDWLSTHNTITYYVLATPIITEIEDINLLNQLNNVRTIDEIDEEYFKDINVNFSKKYGPVNSIVLSRSAESDNVYLSDDESIEENGLTEIKIKDNQFMNSNDRSDYLLDILNKLDGLEYYLNDFSSTGITYYDLCDRYNVKIGESTYSCVMFNDEVNITQGLEENIHTDMPEETETDYTKSDKTDRRINQTYIIVDKQNGTINSLATQTTQLESRVSNNETTIDNNYQEIINKFDDVATEDEVTEIRQSMQTQMDANSLEIANIQSVIANGVEKVITTSGTFDENGLTMEKTNAKTKSILDETGIDVKDSQGYSDEDLFFAGYVDNEKAQSNEDLTSYEGQTVVYTRNIIVKNYFTIGTNSRIEDFEDGTGVFYIGGV